MILEVTAFLIVGLIIYKLISKEEEEDCMIFEGKRKVNYFKVNNDKCNGQSHAR